MNPRYLASSAAAHLLLLGILFFAPWFNRSNVYMIDFGMDYDGDGGGGGGGGGGGLKQELRGQPVPQPTPMKVPEKAGPVKAETKAEETVKVADTIKTPPKPQTQPSENVQQGDQSQKQQTNVIRVGVPQGSATGEGYVIGSGDGGPGQGIGIGFGSGDGSGFGGYGSYLRNLRQKIWSEWTQSAVFGSDTVCVVALTVHRDGSVSDVKLEKQSSNPSYDAVALRAVRNASPVPPLPSSFPKDSQRFRIQFHLLE